MALFFLVVFYSTPLVYDISLMNGLIPFNGASCISPGIEENQIRKRKKMAQNNSQSEKECGYSIR